MRPYLGLEGSNNNPYFYLRIGLIKQVIGFEDFQDTSDQTENKADAFSKYFEVILEWVDRPGIVGAVTAKSVSIKLPYAHISHGWGLQYKPSVGDLVVCGFREGGYPVPLTYLPYAYALKEQNNFPIHEEDSEGNRTSIGAGYFFRNIIDGEYCWKSKSGAEWYLDRKGSLRLIVRDQTTKKSFTNPITKKDDELVLDEPIFEVTVGQVFDSAFETEETSTDGKSIRVKFEDKKTGNKIVMDADGNVEIQTTGSVKIKSTDIELGNEATEFTVKGTSLKQWLDSHIHTTPSGPSGAPTVVLPDATLSEVVKVK